MMQLKLMKLSGFKSFVDPVTITLPSQLIGIVGPNGCGKSNIIDAIRWVLGESSAKNLRGDAMTDVIFNGARSRKAVGQATVELRFDNQLGALGGHFNQYQEISIKRTVNRDGESIYALNGKRCRKRDITDIFLGTGAGSKGYSIISQGTISQLIEAKPLTLRAYIEEAAGISIYKERRRETLQRIEQTKANLERLADIEAGLTSQIERLQKQAASAARYQQLKTEAKHIEQKIAASSWQQYDTHYTELTRNLETLNQSIYELKRKQASLNNQYEQQQNELECQQQTQRQRQQTYYEQKSQLARLEEQATSHEKERQNLEKQLRQADQELQTVKDTIEKEQAAFQQHIDAQSQVEDLLQIKTTKHECIREALAAFQRQYEEQSDIKQQLLSAKQTTEHQQQLCQLKMSQMNDKRAQWMTQLDHSDRQELNETIQSCLTQEKTLNDKYQNIKQEMAGLEKVINTLRQQMTELKQQDINNKHARQRYEQQYRDNLKQKTIVDASIEANSPSIEQHKPDFLTEKRPVFQSIEVVPDWQTCVQWLIPQLMQSYLVEQLESTFVQPEQLKLCGLLIAQPTQTPPKTHQTHPTLASIIHGPMPDTLIKLDKIFLADSLDVILCQRSALQVDESFLTKDGFWVGKTWIQCMPKVSENQTNLFALVDQQKALGKQLESLSICLDQCNRQIADNDKQTGELIEKLTETEAYQQNMTAELSQVNLEMKINQNRLVQTEKEKIKIESLYQQCLQELEDIATETIQLETDLANHSENLTEIHQKLDALAHLPDHADLLKGRQKQVNEMAQTIQQLQLDKQQSEQRRANCQQQIHYWQAQEATLVTRRAELLSSQKQLDAQHSLAHKQSIEALTLTHQQTQHAVDEINASIENQKEAIQQTQQDLSSLSNQLNQIEQQFQSTQLKQHETHIRLQDAHKKLSEWQIAANDVPQLVVDIEQLPVLDQQLKRCQSRIEALGGINMTAQAELETEQERQNVLSEQKNDLLTAIHTLNQAITKIDQDTRIRFTETFDMVNESFQHLFPTVFGGGRASLRLEGDDWLESGVMVMAQPPGKRNSTIHLLSGGEKALTAVALVFALFQLNPSPFCLLDEVDAPLDDTNVGRFCQLVKTMSEQVQFIIITHNKVTMTLAEQLIGVTMREPGVSRLVAVDVAEALDLCDDP